MSMHQIEDFVEFAIRRVATSDTSVQHKRNLIHTLLEMERYGDCSFTNLRTIREMTDCFYSFTFDAEEMYDYNEHPERYQKECNIHSSGQVYFDRETGKYCIDSGSEAWQEMVKAGAITGEGACPVELLPFAETLEQLKNLLGEMDRYTKSGFDCIALLTGTFDEMTDADDEMDEADDLTYLLLGQQCLFSPETYENEEGMTILKQISSTCPDFCIFGRKVPFSITIVPELKIPLSAGIDLKSSFPFNYCIDGISNMLVAVNDTSYVDQLAAHYTMTRGKETSTVPDVPLVWCEYRLAPLGTQCDLFIRIESVTDGYSFDLKLSNSNCIIREGNTIQ